MVSKEPGRCLLAAPESEAEPAASLALEMRYALDASQQIKKRNKALQVRFKDICEAQSEHRDRQLSSGPPAERREAKAVCYRAAAYRKYMTVPARRSIPNVTRSTGVQTSPDLKKCYQTFPPDRKKGSGAKSHDNGFLIDFQDPSEGRASGEAAPGGPAHPHAHTNNVERSPSDSCSEPCKSPAGDSCGTGRPLHNSPEPAPGEADDQPDDKARPDAEDAHPSTQGRVFKTEVAALYLPASGSAAESEWSLCPAAEDEKRRTGHLNGLHPQAESAQACPAQCLEQPLQRNVSPTSAAAADEHPPCRTAVALSGECREIVPHTEVVDLKAQLQVMENLISSSQETIKVLLGVIQELEKGEAHREGYVQTRCAGSSPGPLRAASPAALTHPLSKLPNCPPRAERIPSGPF
uniref:Inhibitory synaptic factor 2A n=1 Tax=Monodelphis domestica TaxID=13616 RepID=H9H6J6_MONDO